MSEEHSYGLDNIKEGDNKFPKWLLFVYITLFSWGCFYLVTFWVMPGDKETNMIKEAPITYKNQQIEGFVSSSKDKKTETKAVVNPDQAAKTKLLADGKVVFEANCAGCHGIEGDGNGPAAAALIPKPRNFIKADFKYGSDDASLIKTIQNGVKGTAMPAWKDTLSADQIKAVMNYERSFKK